jgi:hypothetical protein
MTQSTRYLALAIAISILIGLMLSFGVYSRTADAQRSSVRVMQMTASDDGVWLITDDARLVHCWFPENRSRLNVPAQCRALNDWNVNVGRIPREIGR